jgi:hypothetical protein
MKQYLELALAFRPLGIWFCNRVSVLLIILITGDIFLGYKSKKKRCKDIKRKIVGSTLAITSELVLQLPSKLLYLNSNVSFIYRSTAQSHYGKGNSAVMLATFLGKGSVKTSDIFQYVISLSTGMIQEPLRIFRIQRQDSGLTIMANLLIFLCRTLICTLIRSTIAAKLTLSW